MSYSSVSNAGINDFKPPRLGTVINGSVNTSAQASGATQYQLLNSNITVPVGVWQVSGSIIVDASSGQMTISQVNLYNNGAPNYICIDGMKVSADQHYLVFSGVITSDGTNVLSGEINGTTSGGATWNCVSGDSFLYLTRVA